MKRIGVAGIIYNPHDYTLLLGRRGKDPNRGLYVLPGGGVQDGEFLEEAFQREILEETGLRIQPMGRSRWELPDVIELPDRIILVAVATASENSEIESGSDLYDVAWFGHLSLPDDISPVILPLLQRRGCVQERKR